MKKAMPILLTLSLIINVALGALLYVGAMNLWPTKEENLAKIQAAGTYGPKGVQVVDGDVAISSAGVILQNTLITGDLVLTEAIGDGSVQLTNVTVNGTVTVNGGGESSILLQDVTLENMVVNRPDKKVRLVAKGHAVIKNVLLMTATLLEVDLLTDEAKGFMNVTVETSEAITLMGVFNNVTLSVENARLIVSNGRLEMLMIKETAKNSFIDFFEGALAGIVELKAAGEISGRGTLEELKISGFGLVKLAGQIDTILVGGQGIFVEFTEGRVSNLTVTPSEGMVSVQVPENFVIENMELNGKASVTGKGTIDKVIINQNGSTINQTPGSLELAKGVTAMVGGKKVPEEKETVEPTPTTPKVGISSISDISNLYVGSSATRSVTVNPVDAIITVKSSNTGVATVSVSGKTLTITAVKAGTATISVTAKKAGYSDRTITFKVSAVGPTSIKSFITETGLSPGKTLVIVEIWAKSPQNYTVTVKGTPLNYNASTKRFFGEVLTEDAQRNNVKVSG